MIDRCRTCYRPRAEHGRKVWYAGGEVGWEPPEKIHVGPIDELPPPACPKFEPTHLVEGVL